MEEETMERRYIGMDIGKEKCILALIDEAGNIQLRELSSPSQLMRILQPHDMIAAEYTGALATKWLDTALQCTDEVYIYRTQGIRADKRVVGNRDKNEQHDATAIAKLLKIQTELASPRFMPYRQLKEVFHLRRIVYEAERFTTETVRAQNLIQNAQATGYQIHHQDYLKTLEELKKQAWKRAEQAIKENPITAKTLQVIRQLYPSSNSTAIKITVHITPIERFHSKRALRRYAGLYDQHALSGNQRKKAPLQGNKQLRTALFQLASGAVSSKSRWNRLYKRLREQGKSHTQALIRIATYMLDEIWRELVSTDMHH
jgi:transposase